MTEKLKLGHGRGGTTGAPGDSYNVVDVHLWELPSGEFRADVTERWGSNQGYTQETDRHEVSGWGSTLVGAIERARSEAAEVDIDRALLSEAITEARREVDDHY